MLAEGKNRLYALLRRLEPFTKTDMVYVMQGGFWLSVSQGVASFSAFFVAVAYANVLPPDLYGTYKFIISLAGILAAFTLPGINSTITKAVAIGRSGSVFSGTRMRFLGGLVGLLATLGIALYYYYNGNTTLALASLVLAVFLPFFDTFNVVGAYFHGKQNFRKDALWSNITRIIAAAILIGGVFLTQDLLLLLALYFGSYSLLRILVFLIVLRREKISEPSDPEAIPYGIHLSAINVFNLVAAQIDKVLIFHYLGAVEVAIYSIATALPEHLKSFVRNAATLAAPKYSKLTEEEARGSLPNLWRKMIIFTGVLLLGVGLYVVLAPTFFKIVFPAYLDAIPYSQLYALAILTGVMVLPVSLIQYQQRTREMYVLNIVNYTIQIGALVAFIPLWGIWGAVWARLLSFLLNEFFSIGLALYTYRRNSSSASGK